MSEQLKGLRIKNGVRGKVLTVDANGVAQTSNKDVDDIASASDLSNLTERVAEIEGTLDSALEQLEEINGEEE